MATFVHIPRETEQASAPVADYYLDSERGRNDWPGTLAQPLKSPSALPSLLPAGTRVAFRSRATPYGRFTADLGYTGSVWAANAQGAAGSPVRFMAWGSGPPVSIYGDIPVKTWGPVSNSHGNAFLAANGEQCQLGTWASPFCLHYVGDEVLTPSFWSPASPTPLSIANRWDAVAPYDGSDSFFDTPSAQTQAPGPANINPDGDSGTNDSWWPAVAFDTSKRLSFSYGTVYQSATFGSPTTYETIVRLQWPEIYQRYGNGPGPIGAIVGLVCNPANSGQWGRVTAYDVIEVSPASFEGRLTVTLGVRSPSSGGPVYPTGRWTVMCHPIDLAQEAQSAAIQNPDGTLECWRVKGSWMKGRSSVSAWHKALTLTGQHVRFEGTFRFGRHFDKGTNVSYAIQADATWDVYWQDLRLRQAWSADFNHMWQPSASDWGRHLFDNIVIDQAFTCGGLRFRNNKNVTVNRFIGRDIGRTAIFASGVNDPGFPTIFRNYATFHGGTVHGNGRSAYDRATETHFVDGLNVDRNLNGTHQTDSNFDDCPVPRNIRYEREILLAFRPVQVGGSPQWTAEAMTSDTAFQNCVVDRVFNPAGGSTSGLRINGTGGTEANGKSNNGAVIMRSVFDGISMEAGAGTAKPGTPPLPAQPLTVRDCNSRRGAITAGGGTVLRSDIVPNTDPSKPMLLSDQEKMTRTVGNEIGEAGPHEPTSIGPDWVDWQIPAWNGGIDVGSPQELRLSKTDYDSKQKAGRCCAVALRYRPGSVITLPAGQSDNDLFDLERSYLVPRVRMTALSYTVMIRETTIHGAVRDTFFTLEARR